MLHTKQVTFYFLHNGGCCLWLNYNVYTCHSLNFVRNYHYVKQAQGKPQHKLDKFKEPLLSLNNNKHLSTSISSLALRRHDATQLHGRLHSPSKRGVDGESKSLQSLRTFYGSTNLAKFINSVHVHVHMRICICTYVLVSGLSNM